MEKLTMMRSVVVDYPIPATLSTDYEGQHMETCRRLYPGIQPRDFLARMKRYIVEPTEENPAGTSVRPNTLANRMKRFRDTNGLIPWYDLLVETSAMKAEVLKHLSREQIQNNSTEGFPGLTAAERKAVREATKAAKGRGIKRRRQDSVSSNIHEY